jgi:hypothetical protein
MVLRGSSCRSKVFNATLIKELRDDSAQTMIEAKAFRIYIRVYSLF